MTKYRTRKNESHYKKYNNKVKKDKLCQFCEINEISDQLVILTPYFKVIRNIFPYDVWDTRKVVDHLMIVPTEHIDTLSNLSADAMQEFVLTISNYEKDGYDVFARSPHSALKSVSHQHTHLIKTSGRNQKVLFRLQRPFLRVSL